MTFKGKNFRTNNGQKGGRPKQDSQIYIKIPEINLVNLTSNQYETLLKKYGDEILKNAINILEEWLKSGSSYAVKYIGKNNYAHFRSDGWVINEAKRISR